MSGFAFVITMVGATVAATFVAPTPATAATVSFVRSWNAGDLSPGQSKSYVWNNANSDIYQVSAGGVRVSDPNEPCWIGVTNQHYRRAAGGARQFYLTIKNTDSDPCTATVYLAALAADRSGATGTINPGSSKTWWWNSADVRNLVYIVGVTPDDPGTGTCRLEPVWKQRVKPSGEHEFVWTIRNTGTVACSGTWRLGWLPADRSTSFPADDPPSPPGTHFTLASPQSQAFRVLLFGIVLRPTDDGDCVWGPVEREVFGDPAQPTPGTRTKVGWENVGSVACTTDGIRVALIR